MREEEEVEEVVVGEGEWGVGEAVGQGAVEGAHTMVVGAGDATTMEDTIITTITLRAICTYLLNGLASGGKTST